MFLLTIVIAISTVFYKGYQEYRILINQENIDDKISRIIDDSHYTSYEEIPVLLIDAIVVTEDQRFFNRKSAVDIKSLSRATLHNIQNKKVVEGGSTIPQQLAKNLYLDHDGSLTRKVSEFFIARDLMKQYQHEEILTLYLNVIYFGDGYYGISEASQGYFSKEVQQLTDSESSMLAGLPQAPSLYQLSDCCDLARERQLTVLNRLVKEGKISRSKAENIFKEELCESKND